VHGHDIFLGEQEILHRKHGFFHLACVTHPRNQHFSLTEINDDGGVRVGTIALGVTDKVGHIEDLPLRLVGRVVGVRADEHVAAKEGLPGRGGNDFDGQVVIAVLSHVQMLHPGL